MIANKSLFVLYVAAALSPLWLVLLEVLVRMLGCCQPFPAWTIVPVSTLGVLICIGVTLFFSMGLALKILMIGLACIAPFVLIPLIGLLVFVVYGIDGIL